jgi:hypothetical protein
MEPERICPYPRCDGVPASGALRCPACERKLLTCRACGVTNRAMSTYCRHCGGLLTPEDEWRLPRGNAEQTGYLPAAIRMAAVGDGPGGRRRALKLGVEAGIVAAYDYVFVPTVEKGLQVLHAGNLETVATLESPLGAPLLHPPLVHGGCAYMASPLGVAVYDLIRSLAGGGALKPALVAAPTPVKDHIIAPPLLMGDSVVIATEQGLVRLDPRGATAPQPLAAGRSHLLTRHGDTVVFSPDGVSLSGVDLSGAVRWHRSPRRWQQPTVTLDPRAGLISAGSGSHLLFADDLGQAWVLYPDSGDYMVIGRWPEGITGMALLPDGGGYVVGTYAGLFVVDSARSVRPLVEYEAIECPPVVTRHLVLAGTTGGTLLMVDRATGALDKRPVGSGAVRGIAVCGATVLAVTGEGDVAAYDLPVEVDA